MTRRPYLDDLTDAEWNVLQPFLPLESVVGRPRKWSVRDILDSIFSVIRGGIAWRAMPHNLPPLSLSQDVEVTKRLEDVTYDLT